MKGVAVAWGHIKHYDLSRPFAFRSAIAVSVAAVGHNIHKVTPQIRLHCGSACRGAASVAATSYCIFVDRSCSASNASIQASVSSKVEQQYLGGFDSFDLQDLFLASSRAIARVQRRTIKRHGTARHLCPDIATRLDGKT